MKARSAASGFVGAAWSKFQRVIIVTSVTSNIGDELAARLGVPLTSNGISADGQVIDTRTLKTTVDVDRVVAKSKAHPHSLGTSSLEMVSLLKELAKTEDEVVVVTTSRKLSGTYDATVAADRTLASLNVRRAAVSVVDSLSTDVGQGVVALYAAALCKLKISRAAIVDATSFFAANGSVTFIPMTFDYLVKGGRASFIKALIATMIGKLPLIRFSDGELAPVGTCARSGNHAQCLVASAAKQLGAGRPIWVGISHGGDPTGAAAVETELRKHFDVREVIIREISPTIYLHMGPKALCLAAFPVDLSPWPVAL